MSNTTGATTLTARSAPGPGAARGRGRDAAFTRRVALAGLLQAFAVGVVLHRQHDDPTEAHEAVYIGPVQHWLRDSTLSVPLAVLLLLLATLVARRLATRQGRAGDGVGASLLWAGLGAVAYAVASIPAAMAHAWLFGAGHEEQSFLLHSAEEAVITLRYSFALLVGFALVVGLPWGRHVGLVRGGRRERIC